jgi:hypothetical protein
MLLYILSYKLKLLTGILRCWHSKQLSYLLHHRAETVLAFLVFEFVLCGTVLFNLGYTYPRWYGLGGTQKHV